MASLFPAIGAAIFGTWFPVDTTSSQGLYAVQMTSPDTAYAVGRGGTILKSLDGGMSWGLVGKGLTDQDLKRLYFRNPREGMVLGQDLLAMTEDGGRTWTRIPPDSGSRPLFLEGSRGGRIFVFSSNRGMRFTEDLGRTWTPAVLRDSVRVDGWHALDFPTRDTGFAATSAGIWRSVDRGSSWSLLLPASDSAHPRGVLLTAMHFWSPSEGIVGGSYYPNISKTIDGGESFVRKEAHVSVEAFAFPTPDTGHAAGWNGMLWRSTDRGASWQRAFRLEGSSTIVRDLDFFSPQVGLAVCSGGQILAYRSDATVGVASRDGAKNVRGRALEWTPLRWRGFDGLGRRPSRGPASDGSPR